MLQRRRSKKRVLAKTVHGSGRLFRSSGGAAVVARPRPVRAKSPRSKVAAPPVGDEFSVPATRRKLGLSQEELARVTGYSTRAIAGWEAGQPLRDAARQKLIEADRLGEALAKIVSSEKLGQWLRAPNSAFQGQTPLQLMERGESDRLWRMIFQIDAGVAS